MSSFTPGLLVFAFSLTAAVMLSSLSQRSVLSSSVLFLGAGFLAGEGMLGWIHVRPQDPIVAELAKLALYSVLLVEGMKNDCRELRSKWRLPARALLIGLPLTILVTALLARWLGHLSWTASFLIGAVLSPTDPVFARAIVTQDRVPQRLRDLLNIESGLNDGLALPIVLVLIEVLSRGPTDIWKAFGAVVGGVGLGIAVAWTVLKLEQSRLFEAAEIYRMLLTLAIGLLVLGLAEITHTNSLLGAFAAGATVATVNPVAREHFRQFGEGVSETLKLAGLLVFGALITPAFLAGTSWESYLFALAVLLLTRPAALAVALWGTPLGGRERLLAFWFGPRGFASVYYAILVLTAGVRDGFEIFHLAALVIAFSMIAHSSTDVVLSRWVAEKR